MNFTPLELSSGIDALCYAAGLDLRQHAGEITRALVEYEAAVPLKNAFAAILSDPAAKKHTPFQIHCALKIFMDRFMADYGLKTMDKKLLVGQKSDQVLASTLLGETDVALTEGRWEEIAGEPGSEKEAEFQKEFRGLRGRLFVHEDFILPTLKDQEAVLGLSSKYI